MFSILGDFFPQFIDFIVRYQGSVKPSYAPGEDGHFERDIHSEGAEAKGQTRNVPRPADKQIKLTKTMN